MSSDRLLTLIATYLETRDGAVILGDEPLHLAQLLLDTSPNGGVPVDTALTVGFLRLCRYTATGAQPELVAARAIFDAVGEVDPGLVPAALVDQLTAEASDADLLAERGAALLTAAQSTAGADLLDDTIDVLARAAERTDDDHPDRAGRLSNLALALRFRADRSGSTDDLDDAIRAARRAVDATRPDDGDAATYLNTCADAVHSRFERFGDPTDLDEAIGLHRRAAEVGRRHPAAAVLRTSLGSALLSRFFLAGDPDDLDAAVANCRSAADHALEESPHFATCRANLGSALAARADWSGSNADLDAALTACRDAAVHTPQNHPYRSTRLSNLASALQTRYVRHGDATDLDQAIERAAEAVTRAGADDPYRGMYLSNLGFMLRVRGELGHDGAGPDLDDAVACGELAVAATPSGHNARPSRLSNAAMALLSRHELTESPDDLDRAVMMLRQARQDAHAGDPGHATYESNLAIALHRQARNTDDVASALTHAQAALSVLPAGHPLRAAAGLNIGIVHESLFDRTGDERERDLAVRAWSAAVAESGSPAGNRVAAGRRWAELSVRTGRGQDAVTAYDAVIDLLPLLAWRGVARADRERLLAGHRGVPGAAAAACLGIGLPGTAAAMLERSRAVLWTMSLQTRGDLDRVRAADPALASALERVGAALQRPPMATADPG
ncbi:tetratricopeptide repeat protein [Herbidospora sp. RD11066]